MEGGDAGSSLDVQSAMVEEVLEDSLPVHVASLAQVRRENALEIAKLQAVLAGLQDQFSRGKQDSDQLTVETNRLITKICALEEEGSKTALHITDLEKEISRAIEESDQLKWKLQLKEKECAESDRKLSEYMKKMEAYKSGVEQAEKNSHTRKELETIQQDFEVLESHKTELNAQYEKMIEQIGGQEKTMEAAKKEVTLLEQDVERERARLHDIEVKLMESQQKRLGMETSNNILKKKNSALLTRLKRQVDEQKEKYEQIVSHTNCLMEKIESTKVKLDKITNEDISGI